MASVLGIQAVTDDGDMTVLAEEFEIPIITTLELLAIMLGCGHIDKRKVREIASYWTYDGDKPSNHHSEFKRLFGETAPG